MDLDPHIRRIPDFPKPGILFYDISTLLANPAAWRHAVEGLSRLVEEFSPDAVAAIESRGFLFGTPIALSLDIGFSMIRKVGKLPGTVISHSYDLEYGSDVLQIADGLIAPKARVVLIDDLIATGGTAAAAVELLRKVGAEVVGAVFAIELTHLEGASRMPVPVSSLLRYDGT